jgi:hypothetical protein
VSEYHEFFYDTEFIELGPDHPIRLISIGMVHPASGSSYYAVNADVPESVIKSHKWLRDNVWPYLPTTKNRPATKDQPAGSTCRCRDGHLDRSHPAVKPRAQIASEVSEFVLVNGSESRSKNRLWSYFGSYDHVVLAQLYGTMVDLPKHMPMLTWDLEAEALARGATNLPAQTVKEHHALADAVWHADVARFLGLI